MRGRDLRALVFAAAIAAVFVAAPTRAEECGRSAEGFNAWLNSFKEVARLDGVSPEVVAAALDGVAYDPSVKAHDYGVAAFGHNFAGFAASHITPGGIARGKAMLRTYAGPLAKSNSVSASPGRCWWRSGGSKPASAATAARFRRSGRSRRWPGIAAVPSGFAPS